jgi:uncharacterized membrane protein
MRIKKSILTAIFLASTVLCTWSGNAQAQMFEFRVCNQSNVSASVAVSYPVAKGDEVKGWWIVNAGDCETIGSFPQGPFYFFAEQTGHGNLHWEGGALRRCVQYPGPFERIDMTGCNCNPANETQVGFYSEQIPPSKSSYTFVLTPQPTPTPQHDFPGAGGPPSSSEKPRLVQQRSQRHRGGGQFPHNDHCRVIFTTDPVGVEESMPMTQDW